MKMDAQRTPLNVRPGDVIHVPVSEFPVRDLHGIAAFPVERGIINVLSEKGVGNRLLLRLSKHTPADEQHCGQNEG